MNANYIKVNLKQKEIEKFLRDVDKNFRIPLSEKQDLNLFAAKLCKKATICTIYEDDIIVAMVAGYTKDVIDNMGYISVVATREDYQGNGYASTLVKEFITISQKQGLSAVHLYTDRQNAKAIDIYRKIGFIEWRITGEARPKDMHLKFDI